MFPTSKKAPDAKGKGIVVRIASLCGVYDVWRCAAQAGVWLTDVLVFAELCDLHLRRRVAPLAYQMGTWVWSVCVWSVCCMGVPIRIITVGYLGY